MSSVSKAELREIKKALGKRFRGRGGYGPADLHEAVRRYVERRDAEEPQAGGLSDEPRATASKRPPVAEIVKQAARSPAFRGAAEGLAGKEEA